MFNISVEILLSRVAVLPALNITGCVCVVWLFCNFNEKILKFATTTATAVSFLLESFFIHTYNIKYGNQEQNLPFLFRLFAAARSHDLNQCKCAIATHLNIICVILIYCRITFWQTINLRTRLRWPWLASLSEHEWSKGMVKESIRNSAL